VRRTPESSPISVVSIAAPFGFTDTSCQSRLSGEYSRIVTSAGGPDANAAAAGVDAGVLVVVEVRVLVFAEAGLLLVVEAGVLAVLEAGVLAVLEAGVLAVLEAGVLAVL
jgi:hypothetical protein